MIIIIMGTQLDDQHLVFSDKLGTYPSSYVFYTLMMHGYINGGMYNISGLILIYLPMSDLQYSH